MANLQAATTSDGVTVSDADAVRELCNEYYFNGLEWKITDENEFTIVGYHSLDLYFKHENGDPDHNGGVQTRHFFSRLPNYIEDGSELDVMTVGYTKCRFPHLAQRYVVRPSGVYHADLSPVELVEEPLQLQE